MRNYFRIVNLAMRKSFRSPLRRSYATLGPMTESPLQVRIRARLEELGISARAASLRAGLGPDAIRTILDGRSKSPRGERLQALARALECDVRYLLGESNKVGSAVTGPVLPHALPLRYEVEAGRWTASDEEPLFLDHEASQYAAIIPGLYSQFDEWLEVVKGDWFSRLIPDSYFVQVIDAIASKYAPISGDIVVVVRTRAGGAFSERSLRLVGVDLDGVLLSTAPSDATTTHVLRYPAPDDDRETIQIVAKVTWAHRGFFAGATPFRRVKLSAEDFTHIELDAE